MELEEIVRNRVTIGTLNQLERSTTLQLLHTTTLLAVVVAQDTDGRRDIRTGWEAL